VWFLSQTGIKPGGMSMAETIMRLEIQAADATADDIDLMTRQLLMELREINIDSAQLAGDEPVPAGAKAVDPVTTGAIVMTVLPTALPKLVDFIQAWCLRGQGKTVKFKGKVGGERIEFEGSAEDLQKLISTLAKA
jgi:hypothetical protein